MAQQRAQQAGAMAQQGAQQARAMGQQVATGAQNAYNSEQGQQLVLAHPTLLTKLVQQAHGLHNREGGLQLLVPTGWRWHQQCYFLRRGPTT